MTWRLLLLSLLCLSFSAESKELETCLRSSNNKECRRENDWPKLLSKLCREGSEPNNTIFHCDSEETPLDDHPGTYGEGENITLTIRGEVLGGGCSFEMTNSRNGVTCCYITVEREKTGRRKKLCTAPDQPRECRKPEEYKVEEIISHPDVTWCQLNLINARITDSGVYKVKFPINPAHDRNGTITVKAASTYSTSDLVVILVSAVGGGLVTLLGISLPYYFILRPYLERKEDEERKEDDDIFQLIRNGDEESFKAKLGNKSVFGLRDKNYNNIYHLASHPTWTENMTMIVNKTRGTTAKNNQVNEEGKPPTIFSMRRRNTPIISPLLRCYSNVTPYYLWPSWLGHPTALNSKNKEGDTPLMIAAGEGQKDTVETLIELGVDINTRNKQQFTALYKAIANFKQVSEEERTSITDDEEKEDERRKRVAEKEKDTEQRWAIVSGLLANGANTRGKIAGQNLLHRAVQKNSPEIVKLLAEKDMSIVEEKFRDKEEGDEETAFQLAVRLGFKEIVDFLIDVDTSWKQSDKEIMETAYPAVRGGHEHILRRLVDKGVRDQDHYHILQRELLLKAVEDNNPSAVGFLFKKYYYHTTKKTHSVTDLQATEQDEFGRESIPLEPLPEAIPQPHPCHIEEALKIAREQQSKAEKQYKELVDDQNGYASLNASLTRESSTEFSSLLKEKKEEEALKQAEEKKKELESLGRIVKKLLEEKRRAEAILILRSKESELPSDKQTCQFIIETLQGQHENDCQFQRISQSRNGPAMNLLQKLEKHFEKREKTKEKLAIQFAIKELRPSQKEKKVSSISYPETALRIGESEAGYAETALKILRETANKDPKEVSQFIIDVLEGNQSLKNPDVLVLIQALSLAKHKRDEFFENGETEEFEAFDYVTNKLDDFKRKHHKKEEETRKKIRHLTKEISSLTNQELTPRIDEFLDKFAELREQP